LASTAGKAPTAALAPAAGQVQPALERFAQTLPFRVHATDDFRRGAHRERREVARSMAEIAPDPPGWLTALRFDIDTEGGGAAWIEAELPTPNLIVINPRNGHAHLVYLLGGWVQTDFSDPRRLKVVRYAAAIERAYTAALGADPAYTGRFQHNPLSDAYVTKIGRDAPYSLDELARYVDLNESSQKKRPPIGIGRNVETFNQLRRWAYVAVTDWRIGPYEAWCGVVADRGEQIAADVGAASPRGPLKPNEVDHIVKSVARWVWERYGADIPPLLREARIAAQREREKSRQAAREAARGRSKMTREQYVAPASRRRAEAKEMRAHGMPVREIARLLTISVREVYRLLQNVTASVVQFVRSSASIAVHGSPALSDFKGALDAVPAASECAQSNGNDPVNDDVVISERSTPHGGAIAAAIVSEYGVRAHSAQHESDTTRGGRGVREEINVGESPIAYIQRRIREIVAELREPEWPPNSSRFKIAIREV